MLVPSSNGSRLPENVEAAGGRLGPFRICRRRVEVPNADTQYYFSYYSDVRCDTADIATSQYGTMMGLYRVASTAAPWRAFAIR